MDISGLVKPTDIFHNDEKNTTNITLTDMNDGGTIKLATDLPKLGVEIGKTYLFSGQITARAADKGAQWLNLRSGKFDPVTIKIVQGNPAA